MDNWITIETCLNRIEAEVIKGFLEYNGIQAIVQADDAGGQEPFLNIGLGGVRVQVLFENKEEALKLLATRTDS